MKKIIPFLIAFSLISSQAFAAANDWIITRRDPTNITNLTFFIPTPASSALYMVDITGGTASPKLTLLGSGLSYSGTTLSVSGVPAANVSGLSTVATTGAYSDLSGLPTLASVANSGAYMDLIGRPSLATVATTGAYSDLSGAPSIPAAQVNSDWSAVSGLAQILNKPSLATVATSGAYSDLTGKPSLATVATTGAYSDLTGKPSIPNVTSGGNVTRTPGSCFQVSSTRNALVSYSVDVSTALSLTSGQVGTVAINSYTNSSCTSGLTELDSMQSGISGALVVGLGVANPQTVKVTAWVPSNTYIEIVNTQTTGAPTFAYRKGTEVLY